MFHAILKLKSNQNFKIIKLTANFPETCPTSDIKWCGATTITVRQKLGGKSIFSHDANLPLGYAILQKWKSFQRVSRNQICTVTLAITIVGRFQTFGQTLNCLVHCTGRVIGNDRCEKLEHTNLHSMLDYSLGHLSDTKVGKKCIAKKKVGHVQHHALQLDGQENRCLVRGTLERWHK